MYVKNLKNKYDKNEKEFLIVITMDTESGYVDKNEYRIWQYQKPEAYIGFYKGIENWRELLNGYNIKGTFFLSTQCFDAKNLILKKIIDQLKNLDIEGHEIGSGVRGF